MILHPDEIGEDTRGAGELGAASRRVGAPPDPRYLLTVEETAQRLHLGRTRIYGLINAGQLPAVKIGRSTRIPTKCIEEFIDRLIGNPDLLARF